MSEPLEVSPQQAQSRLAGKNGAILIDVREPDEFSLAAVNGAQLIPMQSVPAEIQRLEALSDERDLFVICHHGVRSLQVVSWLRARGIENCYSIEGGIERWSCEVDRSIPRY